MAMIVLILLQILVVVFGLQNDSSTEIESRIMFGQPATIEDYPYFASILECGAAIISNIWILTAAHCVAGTFQPDSVWVGGESLANSLRVPISGIIINEQFMRDPQTDILVHDIALIRLARPLQFSSRVQPVRLPTSGMFNPMSVLVARGKDETGQVSQFLQKLDFVRLSPEQGISLLPIQHQAYVRQNIRLFAATQIWARRTDNRPSICNGDSGSPLVSGGEVIGLVSSSFGSCDQVRVGLFVNVASYIPWIKAKTGFF